MNRRPRRFGLGSAAGLIALLATVGCKENEEAAQKNARPRAQAPAVVVVEVRSKSVPIVREFVARTEAVETIEVQARVEAILESIEFEEGQPVKKDEVLYRVDQRTYRANLSAAEASLAQAEANLKLANEQVSVRAAEAGLAKAKATLVKAQRDVERLRPLAEKDAVPKQDLDTAIAAELVAEAEVQAQEAALKNSTIQEEVGILVAKAQVKSAKATVDLAKLDLDYCTILSPIDGLIGRTKVNVGNLVGRGEATMLATISSVDPIYVTFAISEGEYLELEAQARKRGTKPNAEENPIELILADDTTYTETGTLVTADRAVAEETGTLQLVATFPNPDGRLRPGQFGRCRIRLNQIPNAVLCPQRAVMEQQSAKTVFVVGDDNVVALRTIQILERYGNQFIVSEGLKAGDRVIIEGQLKARPGSPVMPKQPVSAEPGSSVRSKQDGPNGREGE